MKFTKEDIELIRKFDELKQKGYYCDGGQLTQVYNRVLEKNVNSTNCGSCIRQRISELVDALNRFERLSESKTEQEQTPDKVEENASLDAGATNVETKAVTAKETMAERMARVRAAKKK